MIFIGVGANLSSDKFGPPRAACGAALEVLDSHGITIEKRSSWYHTAPVPASEQPWYVNGVAELTTEIAPQELIKTLLAIENRFGRTRTKKNAPRTIDLDLIAYGDVVLKPSTKSGTPQLPHPRMAKRAFVLLPLSQLSPNWRHPDSGDHIHDLVAALPSDQKITVMDDADGLYGTEWRLGQQPKY